MVEYDSHETPNIYPNLKVLLNDQQQFRLKKINEIKNNFVAEISSDYFDKPLIVLSVTTGSSSIASFAAVIGASVGMASASYSLAFSISTGIVKKTVKNNQK